MSQGALTENSNIIQVMAHLFVEQFIPTDEISFVKEFWKGKKDMMQIFMKAYRQSMMVKQAFRQEVVDERYLKPSQTALHHKLLYWCFQFVHAPRLLQQQNWKGGGTSKRLIHETNLYKEDHRNVTKAGDMAWFILLQYCEVRYPTGPRKYGYNDLEMSIYDNALKRFEKKKPIDKATPTKILDVHFFTGCLNFVTTGVKITDDASIKIDVLVQENEGIFHEIHE
jgi:hypothetical protein